MDRAFILGAGREKYDFFSFHDHFGHTLSFRKLEILPKYVKWMKNDLFPKNWVFGNKFR